MDNAKANITIRQFNDNLSKLKIKIKRIKNGQLQYLGKRGIPLTSPHGAGRLARNLIIAF